MTLPEPTFAAFTADDPNATLTDALTRTLGGVPHRRRADPTRAAEADAALARQLVGLFSKLDAHREALRAAADAGDRVSALKRAVELVTELAGFAPTANDVTVARASVRFITAAQTVAGTVGRGGLFRRRALTGAERDQCDWALRDLVCVLNDHFALMVAALHAPDTRERWHEFTDSFRACVAESVRALECA
jgi:hypothetical protein